MAETNEVRGLTQEEIKAACGYENLQINIFYHAIIFIL